MILFPPVISWVDTTFVLIKVLPLGHKYQPICNALGKMSALPVVQFLWCLHSYSSMCRCCWVAPLITRRKAEQQSGTLLWDAFTGLKLRLDHLLVFSSFYPTSESSHEWESLGDTVNSVSIAFCLSFFDNLLFLPLTDGNYWVKNVVEWMHMGIWMKEDYALFWSTDIWRLIVTKLCYFDK